jgi:hypothetical protein
MSLSRGNRELYQKKIEIIQIFPQVIMPFKDLHYLKSKSLKFEDLPNDSRLQFNKKYKELHGEIKDLILKVETSTRKIPEIEEKLGPARHHLAVLRVEEDDLRPLADKINQVNLQEKVEKEIVTRFRIDRQEKRKIALNETARLHKEEALLLRLQNDKIQEEKDEILYEKRKRLMIMLKDQIHKVS